MSESEIVVIAQQYNITEPHLRLLLYAIQSDYEVSLVKQGGRITQNLYKDGYLEIEYVGDVRKFIIKDKIGDEIVDWIDEYRKLWKDAIKQRRGVMGDKNMCIKRMKRFLMHNDYTKAQIFKATRSYLKHKINTGAVKFIRLPQNFIYAPVGDGEVSDLLTWCEETQNTNDSTQFRL